MRFQLSSLDLVVLILYLVVVMGGGVYFALRQETTDDYYVGGRRLRSGWIALSILATQVSAISLLGGPAFVAIQANGGLRWLQYEFAVPLAMLALILLIAPVLRQARHVTIYEYIDGRFGKTAKKALAVTFLLARGLASGVALYAVALPIAVMFDISLTVAMLGVGSFAVVYTTVGGIEADVFSDVLQLFVLVGVVIVLVILAVDGLGGWEPALAAVPSDRARVIVWEHHGLGDGQTFAFWPMVIGGFFLYMSYYGVDQSQAQRYLSTPDVRSAQRSLLWNGLFRFGIAGLYCFLGVLLAGIIATQPEFAARVLADRPDALVPHFVLAAAPAGIRGLFIAGLLAAAMSTLDSAYNSLSAVTLRDVLGWQDQDPRRLRAARMLTIGWGVLCTAFSFLFANSGQTVIETVNQVGSLFYGPILGLFVLGMLFKHTGGGAALTGFVLGLLVNAALWQFAPSVSWLWWNAIGFGVCVGVGWAIPALKIPALHLPQRPDDIALDGAAAFTWLLILTFALMVAIATALPVAFAD
jgi:SSS family solute:Na+ symporter